MIEIKTILKHQIRKFDTSDKLLLGIKEFAGRIPVPDMEFPELIGIEICSLCNLSCLHCPPQTEIDSPKHGNLDFDLFLKIMDEIDYAGKRRIAIHKDGEPLLYPKILEVLERLKLNHEHEVYLSTNAHKLNAEIAESILENRIDIVNFSIGAATEEFYSRVRGKGFAHVMKNILKFLDLADRYKHKPLIKVQIINLPELSGMSDEIILFTDFWSNYNVKIEVWDKLTWGIYDTSKAANYRYPCYSLWNSFEINSDGTVSACCIDWKHELLTGDINADSIKNIWQSESLNNLRKTHVADNGESIEQCAGCNYWQQQIRLKKYPVV